MQATTRDPASGPQPVLGPHGPGPALRHRQARSHKIGKQTGARTHIIGKPTGTRTHRIEKQTGTRTQIIGKQTGTRTQTIGKHTGAHTENQETHRRTRTEPARKGPARSGGGIGAAADPVKAAPQDSTDSESDSESDLESNSDWRRSASHTPIEQDSA